MKILIFTQKVDRNDTVLGFFHDWVIRFSQKYSEVNLICLEKGEYDFPKNVKVYSLGKESGGTKFKYILNVYKLLSELEGQYDQVFVHMNQEYVLLAGIYWKVKNIPVYLWRNHPKGTLLTSVAVLLSTKVFCTSVSSFTARYKKTLVMPAGVNTDAFKQDSSVMRKKYSVCMVGRVSPVKNIELALEAINILVKEGTQVSFSVVGDTPEKDRDYHDRLVEYVKNNDLSKMVNFTPGVSPSKLSEVYASFEICLNLTDTGSFDKTIVEATSCGTIPVVSSDSFSSLLPSVCISDKNPQNIAKTLKRLLDATEQLKIQKDLEKFVTSQSLDSLMVKLFNEIK